MPSPRERAAAYAPTEGAAVELRLFPLHTVLFPGMPLPLNVFEPRYLQLIEECTQSGEPFGVVLIREGPEVGGPAVPFEAGTTARIERAEPGLLNAVQILARGEQRFRILELHDDRPYLWADADAIAEPPGAASPELLERAQGLLDEFERLRRRAGGEYGPPPGSAGHPREPGALADAIGATGVASTDERQRLLETLDPGDRLDRAVALFEAALEQLRHRAAEAATRRWSGPGALN